MRMNPNNQRLDEDKAAQTREKIVLQEKQK
jgi:hypothetical protein